MSTLYDPPVDYTVFVIVRPNKKNGLTEPIRSRVGTARNEAGARQLIKDDLQGMLETFGGLIESVGTKDREYIIFKSAGWSRVET